MHANEMELDRTRQGWRSNGSMFHPSEPTIAEICFLDIAAGLSKQPCFNGRNPGLAFSVAQHSVMGADSIYRETGDGLLAGIFLLQHAHKHYLGDTSSPALNLFAQMAGKLNHNQFAAGIFQDAVSICRANWDEVIYQAAGIPSPDALALAQKAIIDEMQERMKLAEWSALFAGRQKRKMPASYVPPKLRGSISQWGPMKAEEKFIEAFKHFVGEEQLVHATAVHAGHLALERDL